MARVTAPCLSQSASGSLAQSLTFRRSRGLDIVSGHSGRANARADALSAPQYFRRELYRVGTRKWNALSAPERADYATRARTLAMSGFNLYMREFLTTYSQQYNYVESSSDFSAPPWVHETQASEKDFSLRGEYQNFGSKAYSDLSESLYVMDSQVCFIPSISSALFVSIFFYLPLSQSFGFDSYVLDKDSNVLSYISARFQKWSMTVTEGTLTPLRGGWYRYDVPLLFFGVASFVTLQMFPALGIEGLCTTCIQATGETYFGGVMVASVPDMPFQAT